ncbi:MAG: DUF1800 family protein [Lautropia sp.]|nr:DUF1800 family protein [Lautropia sp.]
MHAADTTLSASSRPRKLVLAATLGLLLSACSGSNDVDNLVKTWQQIQNSNQTNDGTGLHSSMPAAIGSPAPQALSTWKLANEKEVGRFLSQAGYGATPKDLRTLVNQTANAWIENEFAKPSMSLLETIDTWMRQTGAKAPTIDDLQNAWWFSTMQDDQLRQRVTYSLSQIFVISSAGAPGFYPRGMAHYYDTLSKHAFGNYRQLLEDVVRHPMMGLYLTHLRNQKEEFTPEGVPHRVPDENLAREVMQLFSIGLEQLNLDGTPKLDAHGNPLPTYDNNDVQGLARVFTGWSWHGPVRSTYCFGGWHASCNDTTNPGRDTRLMVSYPQFHSIAEKRFLGVTIPAGMAQPEENMKIALDTLFNHPNVGPFIGKQLIQRLVTSNPSPAYVQRVATAFNNNGAGVRGDMKAVIRAILLDPEARDSQYTNRPEAGRIREPLLRLGHWMRAFNASSFTGRWGVNRTDSPRNLNMSVMRAPSVFNFYRPGYSPTNTPISNAGFVAPEMQITQESSAAGYAYYLGVVTGAFWSSSYGIGQMRDYPDPNNSGKTIRRRDINPDYSTEMKLASTPDKLVDHLDTLLMNGQMQADTKKNIIDAVNSITYPTNGDATRTAQTNLRRVAVAIYLSMMSTDYLVLK